MDHVLAAAVAAVFLLAWVAWPRRTKDFFTWPGTTYPIGRLSRFGLGLVYGGLAVVLFVADGAAAEWWWAYLVMVGGIALVLVAYRRDSRTTAEIDGGFVPAPMRDRRP